MTKAKDSKLVGYCRVSTVPQTVQLQRNAASSPAGSLAPTHSGEGKFFFTVMAAFGELERDMLEERTFAGLAAAREQGRVGGRPTVMSPDKLAAARARRASERRNPHPDRQSTRHLPGQRVPAPQRRIAQPSQPLR